MSMKSFTSGSWAKRLRQTCVGENECRRSCHRPICSGKFQRQIDESAALIGLSDRELAVAQAVKKVTDEYNANVEAGKPVSQSLEELQKGSALAAAGFYDMKKAADLNAEAAKGWQSIWSTAANSVADTFAKVLVSGGSLFNGLRDLAKQTVEQIIAYFAKLAVINPILNQVFGSQASWTQLAQFGGAGSGGGIGGIGAGTILGVGAGLLAGVGEFKAAGGGAGGLAGGAAYGVGAYALSGAVTAGVAAAASGGISAGLAAGFASIPVVGWIALGAMAINMISGGKLFGTKATPYGSEQNLTGVGSQAGGYFRGHRPQGSEGAVRRLPYWKTPIGRS